MSDQMIEVKGLEELEQAFQEMPHRTMQALIVAMNRSCQAVRGILSTTPPETAANEPGRQDEDGRPLGYYERKKGEWYPLKKKQDPATRYGKTRGIIRATKAQRAQGVMAYRLVASSQRLEDKWTIEVTQNDNMVTGVVGNNVDYAGAVQGSSQAQLFKTIGWPTVDSALTQATPDIHAAFEDVIAAIHL